MAIIGMFYQDGLTGAVGRVSDSSMSPHCIASMTIILFIQVISTQHLHFFAFHTLVKETRCTLAPRTTSSKSIPDESQIIGSSESSVISMN